MNATTLRDYTHKLNLLLDEYNDLFRMRNMLTTYSGNYLRVPQVDSFHYMIRVGTNTFAPHIEKHLENISLHIRKRLVCGHAHYNNLKFVNKDIKCGLKQHLFRGKCKKTNVMFFENKYVPTDIQQYICGFLSARDAFAMKLAGTITNLSKYRSTLEKLTLLQLRDLPYVFSYRWETYHSKPSCMVRVLKSSKKKDLIDKIVNNIGMLSRHFKEYAVSKDTIHSIKEGFAWRGAITDEALKEKLCCNIYTHGTVCSIFYDPCYIPTEYAAEYLQVFKIINVYADELEQKKIKKEKPKRKRRIIKNDAVGCN
jgi:hypothetical protein